MSDDEAPVDPTESQLAELVRAAAAAAVPDRVRSAVAAADRPDAGPQTGDLWRTRWAGTPGRAVTLAWIRSLSAAGASAVPVSFDSDVPGDGAIVIGDDRSPLGVPLVLHVAAEATVGLHSLVDRLGWLDPAVVTEAAAVAPAAAEGEFITGHDDEEWWPLDIVTPRAELLVAIHQGLGESHPGARITPRPAATAGSEQLSAVALVSELDAFVLVAAVDHPVDDTARLEAARQVLHADQLLNAVCVVEAAPPHLAVVIDRRDVVAAIETPSGRLRPPRQSRPPAAVGTALSKYLDATISPFGRLARTFVEGQALDPRALAVDVSADAVRNVEGSAKSFKTEGKRPGYERVKRHQASITRLVEEALNQPEVDVAAILDEDEP